MGPNHDLSQAVGALAENAAKALDWKTIAAKYGFASLLVLLLMAFIRYDIVKPQREDQHEFMKSVIESNKTHADAARDHAIGLTKMADIQAGQNSALEKLNMNQQQTTAAVERLNDSINRNNNVSRPN